MLATLDKTSSISTRCDRSEKYDFFQSAYKAGHGCETALLRVYNDSVTSIGRGNGAMLVAVYVYLSYH